MGSIWTIVRFAGIAVLLLGTVGCSPRPEAIHQQRFESNRDNLVRIGAAYQRASLQLDRPPRSKEELLPHFEDTGNPERFLSSPIDHQPYVIYWGVDLRSLPQASRDGRLLAHEKHGSDGTRQALTASLEVVVLDETAFRRRVTGTAEGPER